MENTNDLRKAMGCFATGVAIITTSDEQFEPIGVTINSFTSLSLEPPSLWDSPKKPRVLMPLNEDYW